VPTPIDKNNEPDLTPLISAIETLAPFINKGDLIVVESTVFPGTCEQIVIPTIEEKCKLKVGDDFDVAHCPERVNPGDLFWTSENIPRVVGATTQSGVNRVAYFYASILKGKIYDVREFKKSQQPKFSIDSNNELKVAQVSLGSVTKMRSIRDAKAVIVVTNHDLTIRFFDDFDFSQSTLEVFIDGRS